MMDDDGWMEVGDGVPSGESSPDREGDDMMSPEDIDNLEENVFCFTVVSR